ncbi:hypothetical protein [Halorhabdus salina]|uniref:hypothetical protein n=1 Tax=Halorhabdus salina TaxID=2750670 RepID=UPI0015EF3B24|nr:hypothetical protein [Halorhabdus salina]
MDVVETGELRYGPGEPSRTGADSLTEARVSPDGNAVDFRLPWILLDVADPSSKRWSEPTGKRGSRPRTSRIGVYVTTPSTSDSGTSTPAVDSVATGLTGRTLQTASYQWVPWNQLEYDERLKGSDAVLRDSEWQTK